MSRLILAAAAPLWMTACTGFPLFQNTKHRQNREDTVALVCGAEEPTRAELVMQAPQYDGYTLSGRLLIGSLEGRLCLDKRLIANVSIDVQSVQDCTTGLPATFILADAFPPPPRENELLVLPPGYWYGRQLQFLLFSPFIGQRGPDCIEAVLSINAARSAPLGQLRVRAARPSEALPPDAAPL
jgi:hypothetical protein